MIIVLFIWLLNILAKNEIYPFYWVWVPGRRWAGCGAVCRCEHGQKEAGQEGAEHEGAVHEEVLFVWLEPRMALAT